MILSGSRSNHERHHESHRDHRYWSTRSHLMSSGLPGSFDIEAEPSPQPNERTNELDEAEKGAIQRVEARQDAAEMLEFVDAACDQMTLAVEPGIIVALELGRLMRRDHRFTALRVQVGDVVRPRIAAICQHLLEGQPVQERMRLSAVMALSSGQERPLYRDAPAQSWRQSSHLRCPSRWPAPPTTAPSHRLHTSAQTACRRYSRRHTPPGASAIAPHFGSSTSAPPRSGGRSVRLGPHRRAALAPIVVAQSNTGHPSILEGPVQMSTESSRGCRRARARSSACAHRRRPSGPRCW